MGVSPEMTYEGICLMMGERKSLVQCMTLPRLHVH